MKKIKSVFLRLTLKIFRKIVSPFSGKVQYQDLFEELYSIALIGMNIGGGAGANSSGEVYAIKYIKSKLTESEATLFDVGANVGLYTNLLVDHFDANAQIYSFEPSVRTFKELKSNVSATNVSLFNFGFGESDSTITLYSDKENSGLASVYNRKLGHHGIEMSMKEEIELKSIDSFCAEKGINKIDFLKIDVEGHEIDVLKGASSLLKQRKIHFLQFEFGGCNIDSRTYFQDFYFLLKDNYHLHRIVKNGIYPIKDYKEMYEAFTTTNYLAELIDQ